MPAKSRIEWTGSTWNPVTGCTKISSGCDHCYAERMARRLQGMGVNKYRNGFKVTHHPVELEAPLKWKKPHLVFVSSMSDLFHPDVPLSYLKKIFDVMNKCPQHIFQVLTKRSRRLIKLQNQLLWPENVWMGVTVESSHYLSRIDDLRETSAHIKFLSLEPLLSPLTELNLKGIDWVVVGGESGPGARPMKKEWVLDIRNQCAGQQISFFFKQWGGVNKKKTGRTLEGRIWDDLPVELPDLQQSLALIS